MRRDDFSDYLEALIQIGRYATADAHAVEALLRAAFRIVEAATEAGQLEHARAGRDAALRIARRALRADALDEAERDEMSASSRSSKSDTRPSSDRGPKRRGAGDAAVCLRICVGVATTSRSRRARARR